MTKCNTSREYNNEDNKKNKIKIPKTQIKVKSFPGAKVRDIHDNIKPISRHKPEFIILHVNANDALNLPRNKILEKIFELKKKEDGRDKQRL